MLKLQDGRPRILTHTFQLSKPQYGACETTLSTVAGVLMFQEIQM